MCRRIIDKIQFSTFFDQLTVGSLKKMLFGLSIITIKKSCIISKNNSSLNNSLKSKMFNYFERLMP